MSVDGLVMTIMIVDDNAYIRNLIREILESRYEIIECADGAEAIEKYRAVSCEWVIMDVVMKPVDGLEALQKIRSFDPNARIIIMTQFDDEKVRRRATLSGAIAFLSKRDIVRLEEIIL